MLVEPNQEQKTNLIATCIFSKKIFAFANNKLKLILRVAAHC